MEREPGGADGSNWLLAFLDASNSPVVMTDATRPDDPIVYVNPAFERVSGYRLDEVRGRNCRFLQGEDRDQPGCAVVARALAAGEACETLLRNYRKDGAMFWNQLYLFPLRDEQGRLARFVGVQHDVTLERSLLADVQALAAERERLIADLEQKRRHMGRLSLDVVNAQESERKALARELHDELGQRLSALNLLLHRALPSFEAGGAHDLWDQAQRELGALVGLVRDMSAALRPPGLDYFGLEPSIRQLLARRFEDGPAWVVEYAGLPARLEPAVETSVYRIVQESVTNIVRHAQAGNVIVEINGGATGAELELIVRDDGVGFDARHWREQAARMGQAGLVGMGERVELLGGTFSVDSAPGKGTRVTVVLPLRRNGI